MRRIGFFILLTITCVYCLGPLIWQLITSLKPASELTTLPPILPSRLTAEHYISVFTGHPFLRLIINSFVVATCTTFLALVIGSLAAFALAKLNVKVKGLSSLEL
jgi:multiple sugar transport system permease protein